MQKKIKDLKSAQEEMDIDESKETHESDMVVIATKTGTNEALRREMDDEDVSIGHHDHDMDKVEQDLHELEDSQPGSLLDSDTHHADEIGMREVQRGLGLKEKCRLSPIKNSTRK